MLDSYQIPGRGYIVPFCKLPGTSFRREYIAVTS